MFDSSMTGAVGFAMHEERLAQASRNVRLSEAEQARTGERPRRACVSRDLIAQGLVAMAARIAPTVTKPRTGTGALAR
jgi:hypothetical protein